MALTMILAIVVTFLVIAVTLMLTSSRRKSGHHLPPGPSPKPVIGNLLDMPAAKDAHPFYTKLGKTYGPISSLSVFGTTIIVINEYNTACELLEKRSKIYSDRPVMQMLGKLLGLDQLLLLEQPGERFTQLRKITHNQLGSLTAVNRWSDEINIEINRYLLRTLEHPEAFVEHLRRQASTVVLKVVYGYEANQDSSDEFIDLAKQMAAAVIEAGVPGAWLVDVLPALRYVPTWLPGAQWRQQAQDWHDVVALTRTRPFNFTKSQLEEHTAPVSVVSESLLAGNNSDDDISWAALSMLGGGADTTLATMEIFYLAMVLNPDALRKAQEEIDRVVGVQRLITQADRDKLPYTDAVFKETMRWEPIVEVNMPHCTAQDDMYQDYFIPKGAVILENVCGMMHDESIYKNALAFAPQRFLGERPEMSPFDLVWGHGRRTCPGRHLAYVTLWLEISRTIQLFDIKAVQGSPPRREFTFGIVRRPLPFKADIKIRSAEHETLLRSAAV